MHHGVFCGKNANTQPKRILILGESHHINTDAGEEGNKIAGVAATYTTCANVEDYLANPTRSSYRFYDKIINLRLRSGNRAESRKLLEQCLLRKLY